MLSWVKDVLGHMRPRNKRSSRDSLVSTFTGDREEEWQDDSLNIHEREEFPTTNSAYYIRELVLSTPPSPASSPPPSHQSSTPPPSLSTYFSEAPAAEPLHVSPELERCSRPSTPSNTRLTSPSTMTLEGLAELSTSRTSNTPSTREAVMPPGSQQSPPVPGEESTVEKENQSESSLQAAAGEALGLTIDQNPYPSCFLTMVLTNHLGQLVTVQDERYVLVRVMGKLLTVSLNAGPCNMPPCRMVWRAGQPVPLVELSDSTFVEIDAIVSPENKKMHAAVIWQDTKPEQCLQLRDNTYIFLGSRRIACWPRSVDVFAKKLAVIFDGISVSAEVCDAVVFIGLAKATLDELLQHNFQECNATVYKVLEGKGGGRVLYVCTCLWVGQKPPTSSLPMVIKRQKLYSKVSHGLYFECEKKVTLCLDVEASLRVSDGTATLEMELDGSRRSLKATHPLGIEPGTQEAGEPTRVSVHVSKEKRCKKVVAFLPVLIKLPDSTVLDAISNDLPDGHLLPEAVLPPPLASKDRPMETSKSGASAGQNSDEQQVRVSSSLKASAPATQRATVPGAQKTPGSAAQNATATAARKTTGATEQKAGGTAAQKASVPSAQKATGTVAETTGTAAKKTNSAATQKTTGTAAQKTTGTAAQKTTGTAAKKTNSAATQKTTGTATQKTTGTAAQKTTGTAAQKATGTAAQKTTGTAAPKTSGKVAKTKQKSASLSQLSCQGETGSKGSSDTGQQWDYLTCRVLAADSCVAVVTGAGKKIIVTKRDLLVNGAPLDITANVASIVKKFQNLGVIFTQSQEVHEVHGHTVDLVAVAAWLGKKPSLINDLVKQRLSTLKKVAGPKVTPVPPTAPKVIPAPYAASKVIPASPAAPKVTPTLPVAPKVTRAPPAALKVTPVPPSAPHAVVTTVDATCMIMKTSQESVTLIVRSKSLPGNCGTVHARLCDMYANGTPMTQTKVEEVRGQVWHCHLQIIDGGKQLKIPVAWRGKKPITYASSGTTTIQQFRQALSTGDLTSSSSCSPGTVAFVQQSGHQTPPSSFPKVMLGEVTEVLAEGGRVRGEDGHDYVFSLEVCFLFDVCLRQIEPRQVLVVGMVVEFEAAGGSHSSSSSSSSSSSEEMEAAVVQRLWVGGKDSSLAFPSLGSLLDSWCSDNGVSSATQEALTKEAELLSPSLFPTASRLEATTTIDITV